MFNRFFILIFLLMPSFAFCQACSVTLGYNGPTNVTVNNTSAQCLKVSASAQAVNTIDAYVYSTGSAVTVFNGIYSDNNGTPGAALWRGWILFQLSAGWSWVSIPIFGSYNLSGTYWVALYSSNGYHAYNNDQADFDTGTFPFAGALPVSIAGFTANENYAYPCFLDYCQ